jgi:hypothetical protein
MATSAPATDRRVCRTCEKPLSRYNETAQCGACTSGARTAVFDEADEAARQEQEQEQAEPDQDPAAGAAHPGLREHDEREHHSGPHPATPQERCEPIAWRQVNGPLDPGQVIAETCSRLPVRYELLRHGGLRYLRESTRRDGRPDLIQQTPPQRVSVADDLWTRLLRGDAR